MSIMIVVFLLGDWGYGGFASDQRTQPPVPQVSTPVVPSPPILPPSPTCDAALPEPNPQPQEHVMQAPVPDAPRQPDVPEPSDLPQPSDAPEHSDLPKQPDTSETRAPVAPVGPAVWRLADASGQVWEHPDRDWLQQWVAGRNASLAAWQFAPRQPAFPACASGRCGRPW